MICFGLDNNGSILTTMLSTVSIATITSSVLADVITTDKEIPSLFVRKNMSFTA